MPALNDILRIRLGKLAENNLLRLPYVTEAVAEKGAVVRCDGRELVCFSSNDYLGLAQHPRVKEDARRAVAAYGAGAGASRLISGNHPLYEECEAKLARWKGRAAACVFGSGYLANAGTIAALMGKDDLIIADKLVHASLIDGVRLSGAVFRRFAHNSVDSCKNILEKHRNNHKNCLLISEAIFSMDGDVAPVAELLSLAQQYDSWLLLDEAHLPDCFLISSPYDLPQNEVSKEAMQDDSGNIIISGTLSKALGSYGGFICGSRELISYLKTAARSLIYSTALPASALAAASTALDIVMQEPQLWHRPLDNARLFTQIMGMPPANSAIVPLIIGDEQQVLEISAALAEQGFLVSAIRPPTVPVGTARLRFSFSALHSEEQVRSLAQAVQKLLKARAAA